MHQYKKIDRHLQGRLLVLSHCRLKDKYQFTVLGGKVFFYQNFLIAGVLISGRFPMLLCISSPAPLLIALEFSHLLSSLPSLCTGLSFSFAHILTMFIFSYSLIILLLSLYLYHYISIIPLLFQSFYLSSSPNNSSSLL